MLKTVDLTLIKTGTINMQISCNFSRQKMDNQSLKLAQIKKLFNELDTQNKGYLDAFNLQQKFNPIFHDKLSELSLLTLSELDNSKDGRVTFEEFKEFVENRDRQLRVLFEGVSKRGDPIELNKLVKSIEQNGIKHPEKMVRKLLDTIDSDNNGIISYAEWRDFFLFMPNINNKLELDFMVDSCFATLDFNADALPVSRKPDNNFKYLLAGGLSGAISRTATAPLDRLKVLTIKQVLLQNETRTHRSYSQVVSIRKGLLKIYQTGGITSFFKGNLLNVVKIIPESALKFYVFESIKGNISGYLKVDKDNLPLYGRFLAGGAGGLVSQFVVYPIETVKTRLMSQITTMPSSVTDPHTVSKQETIVSTIKQMFREQGIKSFYRGCGPALVGIVPYAGVDMAVYETLKVTCRKIYGDKVPIPVLLSCGVVAGACGGVLMYPLSLVRTRFHFLIRLQAQGTPSHPTFYNGSWDCIKKTYGREGVVGFYRGLAPTMLKVLPAISISYVIYEHTKRVMKLD